MSSTLPGLPTPHDGHSLRASRRSPSMTPAASAQPHQTSRLADHFLTSCPGPPGATTHAKLANPRPRALPDRLDEPAPPKTPSRSDDPDPENLDASLMPATAQRTLLPGSTSRPVRRAHPPGARPHLVAAKRDEGSGLRAGPQERSVQLGQAGPWNGGQVVAAGVPDLALDPAPFSWAPRSPGSQ